MIFIESYIHMYLRSVLRIIMHVVLILYFGNIFHAYFYTSEKNTFPHIFNKKISHKSGIETFSYSKTNEAKNRAGKAIFTFNFIRAGEKNIFANTLNKKKTTHDIFVYACVNTGSQKGFR